jgi:hypothetical protein
VANLNELKMLRLSVTPTGECRYSTFKCKVTVLFPPASSSSHAVSTVSGNGLDDQMIGVRSPAEAKGFFLLASVSRPSLGPSLIFNGYRGSFPGG